MRETNKKMILNNNENNIVLNQNEEKMDMNMSLNLTLTKAQLLEKCKELGITKCSSKTKPQLIELISNKNTSINLKSDSEENVVISETLVSANEEQEQGELRFIDLFCGIGGFHQALSKLGAKCVLACDIDKDCRTVYKDNYGHEPVSNIKEIDEKIMPDFDILCGGFPCFVAGTQTLTNNGYKNIEDVQLTDKLLTHTGQFQNILNLQRKIYNGQLFDLKIKYHPEIITATEEHPFYVREKKKVLHEYSFGEPEWKTASNLSMNDYFGMVINNKKEVPTFIFEEYITIDNPDQWFTMGYYFGKQSSKQVTNNIVVDNNTILFSFNEEDVLSLNKVKKVLTLMLKRVIYSDESSNSIRIYKCDNINWVKILTQFTDNKIPEWIQNAPKKLIKKFINGYISSIGYSNKNSKTKLFVSSSNLAYGFQRLYLKLGHIIKIKKVFCNINQQNIYQLCILHSKKQNIMKAFIEGNYVWYAPFKITKKETTQTPVYNFEVETDNSYIVENVCVHNCQAFSNGGKKLCFEDDRGLLFDEIVRIARVKKPKFMFLENVKHILKVSNGKVIDYIKQKIASIGYTLQLFQISPHNYGIPQQRERVYFVCVRNDIYNGNDIVLPTYSGKLEFTKFLDKKEEIDPKYFIKDDTLKVLEVWDEMIKHFEVGEKISPTIMMNDAFKQYTQSEFDAFPDWKRDYITKNKPLIQKYYSQFIDWYNKNTAILQKKEIYGKLEWQTGLIKEHDSIFNHFIQIRQSGIRVKKGNYFPTLVAISQIPIYGKEKRYITPRECARLQSFPETFKLPKEDKKSYKQLGNSVNVDNVFTVISSTLKNYSLI